MQWSRTKRQSKPSKTHKIQSVGKIGGSLDSFKKQMQKNKSDGEEVGRITAILTGIFDEMKDLKNEMKKITLGNKC